MLLDLGGHPTGLPQVTTGLPTQPLLIEPPPRVGTVVDHNRVDVGQWAVELCEFDLKLAQQGGRDKTTCEYTWLTLEHGDPRGLSVRVVVTGNEVPAQCS